MTEMKKSLVNRWYAMLRPEYSTRDRPACLEGDEGWGSGSGASISWPFGHACQAGARPSCRWAPVHRSPHDTSPAPCPTDAYALSRSSSSAACDDAPHPPPAIPPTRRRTHRTCPCRPARRGACAAAPARSMTCHGPGRRRRQSPKRSCAGRGWPCSREQQARRGERPARPQGRSAGPSRDPTPAIEG